MSEIYHQYQRGEVIPSSRLAVTPGGLELYGEVIHFDWRNEHATSSPDFFGEVHLQKVKPVETDPILLHLNRIVEVKNVMPLERRLI